jgi:hypothetical protein
MLMPHAGGCAEAVELLNIVFQAPLIFNDGHEILARLRAGDELVDIADDLNRRFGSPRNGAAIAGVIEAWPSQHRSAVAAMVRWALGYLDTDDRVMIQWKGDTEHPETVTRFELRDHTLVIEFAHPPGSLDG